MSDLIIWPCCAEKNGIEPTICGGKNIEQFLDDTYIKELHEGRIKNLMVKGSKNLPALDFYTGNLYKVPNFKDTIRTAVQSGIHCLILSAGYGLIRADEPINSYDRTMNAAKASWTKDNLLPNVFSNYLTRNKISKVYITASCSTYAPALFIDPKINPRPRFQIPASCDVFLYIPMAIGKGALVKVPKMQGEAVHDLIKNGMKSYFLSGNC